MEVLRLRRDLLGQIHARKARHPPAQRGFPRGQRIDALVVAEIVAEEERQAFGQDPGVLGEVILVADVAQVFRARFRGQVRQVVLLLAVEPGEVRAHRPGERGFGEELRPGLGAGTRHQPVGKEMLLVEEGGRAEALVGLGLVARIAGEIDAEVRQQLLRGEAVGERRFDAHRAAVGKDGAALVRKLVALGVPAEIVVVVEDEDAAVVPQCLPVEPGGGQAGDTTADNDEIIVLAAVFGRKRAGEIAIARHMGRFERPRILAAQALLERGIAGRRIGGRIGERLWCRRECGACRDPADEIASGNRQMKPQFLVRPFAHRIPPFQRAALR